MPTTMPIVQLLLDHIVNSTVTAADLTDGQMLSTLGNTTLSVAVSPTGVVTVTAPGGGAVATVVEQDIEVCSSVIHTIDTVLVSATGPFAAAVVPSPAAAQLGADPALPEKHSLGSRDRGFLLTCSDSHIVVPPLADSLAL